MKKALLAVAASGLLLPMRTEAVSVFSDNFNSENGGITALNYSSFANFTVSAGTVDLINHSNLSSFAPGNGLYIDLDGSTVDAGVMTSSGITLLPGNYVLSFDLAGSQRSGGPETINVSVAPGLASGTYTRAVSDPFSTESLTFSIAATTTINLEFANSGGDNVGALLDNIDLQSVGTGAPDAGASAVLLALGFGTMLLGSVRARRS